MGRSKDTIRVFLRIRPERFKRPVGAAPPAYHIEHTFDDSSIAFHVDRRQTADIINNSVEDFRFRFDRIFEPSATQSEVFDTVARDCVLSALDGYNSTIFAYGQTGSGKTFSITGGTESYDDRGIIPRALSLVFDEVARRADSSSYVIRISYLQIYNDKGQDLLNRGKDAKTLEELPVVTVQETEEEVLLKGLEGHVTSSVSEALNLLFLGDTNRLYCETPMNKTSSRSHCVFTISFESRSHDGTAAVRRSKLHLVDLAGSERVAKTGVVGQVLTEAKYINLSLHFLEHVITSLSDAARGVGNVTHIPFRNSMMTMVLRDSLGGNCRTAMLATAYPTSELFLESISTCKFAQRVAQIEQHAKVNEVTDATVLIRQLKQQVAQLKEQLGLRGQDTSSATSLRDLSLDELSRCKELVRTFVEDPDPNAQLTGLGGDYARIVACFQILKQMIRLSSAAGGGGNKGTAALLDQIGGGGGGGRATSSSNSNNNNNNNGASAARTAAVEALEQQLEAMTVSLQQKENELSLLLQIVESHHRPKFNASTQTGASSSSSSSSGYSSAAAAAISTSSSTSTSFMAAPPPIHPAAITSSSSAAAAEDAAQALADRQVQLLQDRGYNFNALTDRELLRDRATAFEHFRRSYRKFEQVEQTKTDLKRRYESCKQLADRVNQLVETIKRLKARVQHLRAERVLTNSTSEPEPEETEALRQLDGAKQSYGALVKQLGTEKEQVEHIQLMMSRTQEQMSKDFDEWFGLRQQQLVLATNSNNNTGRQPSPPPPASTSFASLSNPSNNTAMQPATPPTPPQQQQQVVTLPALYHPPSRSGGGGGGAASTMTGGGGGRLGGGGSSSILNQHSYDERGGVVVGGGVAGGAAAPLSADGMGGGGGLLSGSVMSRLNAAASQRVHVNSAPSTSSSSFSATTTAGGGGAHHQHYSSQQQQATSTTTTLSNNFFPTTGSSSSSSQSQQQRPNPYAPNYPSTGNAQADAELAEMYKARELMRAKLLTGGR